MDHGELELEALALQQMGRFTRAQAAERLVNHRSLVQSRLRSGRWRRLTSRVLCLPGAPRCWQGDMWTNWLHVGSDAVVSHYSAARLHRWAVDPRAPDSLIVPSGSHRRAVGAQLHQRGDLDQDHVEIVDGLPVTGPARTLYDLGATVAPPRLEAWLDELTMQRRVHPAEVARLVTDLSRSGKAGVPGLASVLSDRLPGTGVEQGKLERALTGLTRLADVPAGFAQYPHPGRPDGGELADRAWPDRRLVVEADGRCWHDRMAAARADSRRDSAAAAAGWQTVRYGYEELVRHPDVYAVELRSIHEHRVRIAGRPLTS